MESEPLLSSCSLSNSSSINKSTYSTCNLQLNNNPNTNSSSISNNLAGNGVITNHHAMMRSNNIINNLSDCNKLQLTTSENPNLNMFMSSDANSRNVNSEIVKDGNHYKTHLMDESQKFSLNNKHISCQQRDTQNNHYTRMLADKSGTSLPLNLCQVNFNLIFFLHN